MSGTTIPAQVKNDPQFKALASVLGSDAKALEAFNRVNEGTTEDPRIQELVDAGFSRDKAVAALTADEPAEVKVEAPKAPKTAKEKADALVEKKGLAYAKGRVYTTTDIIEAQVRVMRSGKAEIVQSSGVGRTKAVLVTREESGDVALQNLTTPA